MGATEDISKNGARISPPPHSLTLLQWSSPRISSPIQSVPHPLWGAFMRSCCLDHIHTHLCPSVRPLQAGEGSPRWTGGGVGLTETGAGQWSEEKQT